MKIQHVEYEEKVLTCLRVTGTKYDLGMNSTMYSYYKHFQPYFHRVYIATICDSIQQLLIHPDKFCNIFIVYLCTSNYTFLILQIFDGVDICRGNPDGEVKNFTHPVIAQYIRIVPLEWEGVVPCMRLELYGCYAKGHDNE